MTLLGIFFVKPFRIFSKQSVRQAGLVSANARKLIIDATRMDETGMWYNVAHNMTLHNKPFAAAISSNKCIKGSKDIDSIHEWLANVYVEFTSLNLDVRKNSEPQEK